MASEFILRENVLTDNVLTLASKGKVFKGQYIAIIEEFEFQNAWSDKKSIKRFRSVKTLINYLNSNYPEVEFDFTGTCIEHYN